MILKNAQNWEIFVKDVKALEPDEERVLVVEGRAVLIKLAEVVDLDRIQETTICMD